MPDDRIHLKIILPSRVFADVNGVSRVVIDTPAGSWGFLPHRLDCVALLVPGILSYETDRDGEVFVAVDEGTVIKKRKDVMVSVRRAQAGKDLDHLRHAVEKEFLTFGKKEKSVREAMAKIESSLIRQLANLHHE